MVAEYPTPAAAAAAFTYLRGHLDTDIRPSTNTATRVLFQDFEKKFGLATVSGRRIDIRVHLVKSPG
jgi:hypothetical protein